MACPAKPVQALPEPSHQFALDEVQPFVGLVDHEDVLLAPAVALCIGKIKSGQHDRRMVSNNISPEKYYNDNSKEIPMRRFGEAEEAATAIIFFASSMGSYVTGSSLNLDGGTSGVL